MLRDNKNKVFYSALIGTLPGLVKGISDGCHPRGSGLSIKDMTYNFARSLFGSYIGTYSVSYYKTRNGNDAIMLGYSKKF